MADDAVGGGEIRDGGGRCCTPNRHPPVVPLPQKLDVLLSKYVLFHMYLLKAVTGLGYLALTWSTVVLLGGFITALTKKDFWCITVISLMQAARIFHDLADQLLPNFFKLVTHIIRHNYLVVRYRMWRATESFQRKDRWATVAENVGSAAFVVLAVLPFLVLSYVPAFLYVYGGPVACIALAIWRMVQRDYGEDHAGDGKANLAPALDMFYSLVLLQGGLLMVWLYHESWWVDHLITLRLESKLPSTGWCRLSLVEFLCDTRARCWRNLSSIRGRKLVDYAVGLLDSGSWDDNLSGARLLEHFITHGMSDAIRSLLLPCRSKIQKLIDAVGWRDGRRPEDVEMRKLAARIVANLAGDLHLSQFPGAIECISYLLHEEATMACSDQQGLRLTQRPQRRLASEKQAMVLRLEKREARHQKKHMKRLQEQQVVAVADADGGSSGGGGGGCNELILQGLAILEGLATDRHNCGEICSSHGLLDKITAPLYSSTLVQDISIADWVHVANATFKVVCQLIHAPGESSTRLRAEISENKQAMRNLEAILGQEKAHPELQMRAMEILTQLALDVSIDIPTKTKETLMKKQMHIFLTADGDLRATAGRTLVLTKCGDVDSFDRLVQILDDKNIKIKYRMIAAEILENMCAHCDKQRLKDILLKKVLSIIMSSERENVQRNNDENNRTPAPGQDEENQNIPTQEVNTQIQETSSPKEQNKSSDQGNEGQTEAKQALQAKLLSLTLVMYVKLGTADFSNVLQKQYNRSAFVAKLKTMIKENCQATVGSLNIVKLCAQIAVSMMQCNQYTEHFKNQEVEEFVKSVSEARIFMSNLESCVLFAGRDHRLRKMARPLLMDLEKEARKMVG